MNISPSFLNRFNIINLEDQLENISFNELKVLISILLDLYMKHNQRDLDDNFFNLSYKEEESDEIDDFIFNEEESDEDDFIFKEEDKIYLTEKLYNLIKKDNLKNQKGKKTIKDLARICYSLNKIFKMKEFYKISNKSLINFIYELHFTENEKISEREVKERKTFRHILSKIL